MADLPKANNYVYFGFPQKERRKQGNETQKWREANTRCFIKATTTVEDWNLTPLGKLWS